MRAKTKKVGTSSEAPTFSQFEDRAASSLRHALAMAGVGFFVLVLPPPPFVPRNSP